MPNGFIAVAFDVDAAGLASLREALPDWEIEALKGATATSLTYDWRPGEADLLIVQAREKVAESLSLCRFLVSWGLCFRGEGAAMMGLHEGRQGLLRGGEAPLLVLASAGQKAFVKAAFEAGAHSCLVLPVGAEAVAGMWAHARTGAQTDRRTPGLERARSRDRWRDDGGQG